MVGTVGTRTPDLYRVNFEVKRLQPFSCLAFPFCNNPENSLKWPIFGDELVTSFRLVNERDRATFITIRFLAQPKPGDELRLRAEPDIRVETKFYFAPTINLVLH